MVSMPQDMADRTPYQNILFEKDPRPAGICSACWAGFIGLPETCCGVGDRTRGRDE